MQAAWRFTGRGDGDLSNGAGPELVAHRNRIAATPWTWLRQVHGSAVVAVTGPGEQAGVEGDAAVTDQRGAVLAVQVADCVPIVLVGRDAVGDRSIGIVHAGWRGLAAGVVGATVDALAGLGSSQVVAHIGPHIRARCYEFGAADLDRVAGALGPQVRSTTAWGTPALDLTAGLFQALGDAGVTIVDDTGTCTACSPVHFSHRARGDTGRQAGVAWLEDG